MSRTKGSSAQPGPPRWRQQPEPDVNAHAGGHYTEPAAGQQGASPHFPQHAFPRLDGQRPAPVPQPRPTFAGQQLERPLAAQAPRGQDRLSQRLQHADPRTAAHPGWPSQPDPSGYDLAHYAPEQPAPVRGGGQHDPYAQQSYMDAASEGWTGGGWNGQSHGYAEPPLEGGHYEGHAQGDPNEQDYAYDTEEEDVPAARRGPRAYVVVGALVGAIAAGGGLAYAYKNLGGSGADGTTPIVRAERAPAKAKPTDAGGREIAHTDKKFINRLTDDKSGAQRFGDATAALATPDASATGATDADGAPRKVTTLVVNRDGSMAPPNPVVPLPQNNTSPLAGGGVPGMVIEGLNTGSQRPQLRGSAVVESQAPVAAPAKPQIIARATPAPEPPQRAPQKPVQREEVAVAAPAAARAAVSVAPAAAGNGFVSVLTSQKSRMDALKAFADMQQKYTNVLQNRTPDVREVDLGDKGVWHRLVIGPPASREAASTVCTQLKAHGYSGCWVTAY